MHDAFFLALIVLTGTGGELAVTRAMKEIGEVHEFHFRALTQFLARAVRVGWMWAGIGLMTVAFFSLLTLLSVDNVSFVIPVTALSYAAGALGGKYFLGERMCLRRWVGVFFVCLGVSLVWMGR